MSSNISSNTINIFNPKKFGLWLILLSIVMIFASLTSAYIVRRAEGNWLEFDLPDTFIWSTLIIILSSITMQASYLFVKKDSIGNAKINLFLTTILGFVFMYLQLDAWSVLVQNQVFFGGTTSNPAGSFLYVLTGVHLFHIVTGLIFLLILIYKSFTLKVSSKNMLSIEMCNTYWHFLGFLWIYLYSFLLLNN